MSTDCLVLGLGKSGLSLVRALRALGFRVAACDSRENPPELARLQREYPEVEVRLGDWDADYLSRFSTAYVSPGIALKQPALQEAARRGLVFSGDMDLFSTLAKAPIVAITGSNGKSTVTTLVGEMAKAAGWKVAVGGNLGTPALDLLADDVELYVLELSSFQLETCRALGAQVACCLNLSEDHMDRYASLHDYRAAKLRIFNGAASQVVNVASPSLSSPDKALPTFSFGFKDEPAANHFGLTHARGVYYLTYGDALLLPVAQLKIRGTHNYDNALAALALGHAAGLPMAFMLDALRAFKGLSHRCEFVRERQSVSWYNDSKATNVGAAVAAIEGLGQGNQGKLLLIAGGDGKGADFSPLRLPVSQYCRAVLLLGRDAGKLESALQGTVPLHRVDSLEQAVQRAAQLAQAGDSVLLSPACASLDMFKNFEQRGDIFAQCVEALA